MSFERQIHIQIDDMAAVRITAAFTESDRQPDDFSITVRDVRGYEPAYVARWTLQQVDGTFTLVPAMGIGTGLCLAGCFADVVTGDLVGCLAAARSRADARACISQHGFGQALKSLACVLGCLGIV
ncbi:hypothetical protein FHS55_002755 [Angulomicrobium tetraedrale]|uniref:Uncharacterized protein n=1 Tax=Ancylobacter tetraedralis TaxID=217068 RepID=A0A839ZBK2_9HYPH|nr:hypothetical protein [Ancylobacter tetraedralis]MBB3772143.1 hypothetical protein [Ancylobacter tetraedralis]